MILHTLNLALRRIMSRQHLYDLTAFFEFGTNDKNEFNTADPLLSALHLFRTAVPVHRCMISMVFGQTLARRSLLQVHP